MVNLKTAIKKICVKAGKLAHNTASLNFTYQPKEPEAFKKIQKNI